MAPLGNFWRATAGGLWVKYYKYENCAASEIPSVRDKLYTTRDVPTLTQCFKGEAA
jgi:hypothetical protein